ncbi:MAG: 2,3,4,5-tetrahydropyridine-2,6-dicarboxylate N-succinyltransferase [Gammaproteobacteria bacterium]
MQNLKAMMKQTIEAAYERRDKLDPQSASDELRRIVQATLDGLNCGELRVAEPDGEGGWQINEWLKKAILVSFCIASGKRVKGGDARYYDKVPLKYSRKNPHSAEKGGVRVVPPATVRYGAHIAPGVVLMPSYVNIGAFVDAGTMVDTWATVGSCAQIGKNVHLSGGAGIGGVLEPPQASPTIIEDDCFIGARSEIVEGVVVGKGAVIAMGVFIGQSTKIYDRESGEILYGKVPPGSVVVPGSLPAKNKKYALNCAIIVKKVDEQTRAKTAINELLRED